MIDLVRRMRDEASLAAGSEHRLMKRWRFLRTRSFFLQASQACKKRVTLRY